MPDLPIGEVVCGDCLDVLRGWPAEFVDCCVTSPPYWGLRDYGVEGQLGLEPTPEAYVARMVAVFAEVRRVLKPEGTLWLNLGDSYAGYWGDKKARQEGRASSADTNGWTNGFNMNARPSFHDAFDASKVKPKDLIGIPWRVAFALQADGWYLRSDIIWAKPNPMPESVTDRPTSAHEHIFLLSKSARYYYDADAIAEPVAAATLDDLARRKNPGQHNGATKQIGKSSGLGAGPRVRKQDAAQQVSGGDRMTGFNDRGWNDGPLRNARNVWNIATQPYSGAHFAVFPPEIPRRCILAGCPPGGIVLDVFGGSGTTGMVAENLGRRWVMCELNPEYCAIARARTAQRGLFV